MEAAASLGDVTRSYPVLLLTLSAIWGASYLFIKVGVRAFEPFALVELRIGQPQSTMQRLFWRDLRQAIECSREGRRAPDTFKSS